jgi:hypothetical protein
VSEGDWYDELRKKDRRQHERLCLPEFDTAPVVASDSTAPDDAAVRYLRAMGEKPVSKGASKWTCGCTVGLSGRVIGACAKHRGKVA